MKCPDCQFVCSDLRDICPRCLVDLRPFKRSVKLAVTHPELSYEVLLQRSGLQSRTSAAGDQVDQGSLVARLRGIFGAGPSPIRQHRPGIVPAPPQPVADDPSASMATELRQPEVQVAAVQREEAQDLLPSAADSGRNGDTASSANPFDFAFKELSALQGGTSYEMRIEQFVDLKGREDIALYFDLAHEALLNPESEKKYQQQVFHSEQVQLQSDELVAELRALEQRFSAPLFTLKGMKTRRSKHPLTAAAEGQRESAIVLATPSARHRISAFLVDGAVIIFFAIVLAGLPTIAAQNASVSDLLSFKFELYTYLPVLAAVAVCAAILIVAYPLVMFGLLGTTFGLDIFRIQLFDLGRRRLSALNLTVRCLLAPLSLFLVGLLPMLFGGRPLHERLSRTILMQFPLQSQ